MPLVLVLEGNCQITQRGFSIRLGHVRHVVTLDRLHDALGHAVALRAANGCRHRLQTDLPGKQARLFGGVRRTVNA